jgi:hypothetical protein
MLYTGNPAASGNVAFSEFIKTYMYFSALGVTDIEILQIETTVPEMPQTNMSTVFTKDLVRNLLQHSNHLNIQKYATAFENNKLIIYVGTNAHWQIIVPTHLRELSVEYRRKSQRQRYNSDRSKRKHPREQQQSDQQRQHNQQQRQQEQLIEHQMEQLLQLRQQLREQQQQQINNQQMQQQQQHNQQLQQQQQEGIQQQQHQRQPQPLQQQQQHQQQQEQKQQQQQRHLEQQQQRHHRQRQQQQLEEQQEQHQQLQQQQQQQQLEEEQQLQQVEEHRQHQENLQQQQLLENQQQEQPDSSSDNGYHSDPVRGVGYCPESESCGDSNNEHQYQHQQQQQQQEQRNHHSDQTNLFVNTYEDWRRRRSQRMQRNRLARSRSGNYSEQDVDTTRRRNTRRRQVRENRRTSTQTDNTDDLHTFYNCSGSVITANSRRLQYLVPGSPEYIIAKADVMKDINDFAHVGKKDYAYSVQRFTETATMNKQMYTCGSCGLRDPQESYFDTELLKDLPDDHWMVIPQRNLEILMNGLTAFTLLVREGVDIVEETFSRLDLLNIHIMDRGYHVITEALIEVPANTDDNPDDHSHFTIKMCSTCHKGKRKKKTIDPSSVPDEHCSDAEDTGAEIVVASSNNALSGPERLEDNNVPYVGRDEVDGEIAQIDNPPSSPRIQRQQTFPPDAPHLHLIEMYTPEAPINSIASGADYGRLIHKLPRPSTLEQLVLAESRCYTVTLKVVANQRRKKLIGHTIIFPQTPEAVGTFAFGSVILAAALSCIRIVLVGPLGEQTRLERSAILLDDLVLRPEVIFNHLKMRHILRGGPAYPTHAEIKKVLEEYNTEHFVRTNARRVDDDIQTVEKANTASDIAGVRENTDSLMNTEEKDLGSDTDEGPSMQSVGVHEHQDQHMGSVIQGIEESIRKTGEAPSKEIKLLRAAGPLNDYNQSAMALYQTWWPLFPLQQGLQPDRALSKQKYRHLFLYYDNRFAQNIPLLFYCADVIMRHAANTSVHVRVKNDDKSFNDFKELTQNPTFLSDLKTAAKDPKGPMARALLRKIHGFVQLCGKSVPWGRMERSAEIKMLMELSRTNGAANIFYTFAPDDVHSLLGIMLSYPISGENVFPSIPSKELQKALESQVKETQVTLNFNMSEKALQELADRNPIATTLTFHLLQENIRINLQGITRERKTNQEVRYRLKGMFGIQLTNHDVIECNKRASLHAHGQSHGGLTPALLGDVAGDPDLLRAATAAIDTQVQAEIPLEYHAVFVCQSFLKLSPRRDAAAMTPTPPENWREDDDALDNWWTEFRHHALITVLNRNTHKHKVITKKMSMSMFIMCILL